MSDEPDVEADEPADAGTEGEAGEQETPEESGAGLSEGDFVKLAYTIRTVEDGNVVDTTDGDLAEEEGLETEGRSFEPRTLVLGSGQLFPSVEEDLYGKEVGDTGAVEIPATEAFGEYDPDEVRTVSADRIPEDSRHPGGHVDIDGQHGHVETIIGGRARVDFNHPLAGEDLEYEYEVIEEVEDRVEQAKGLLSMYVDVDLDCSIETDEVERTVYDEDEEERTETEEVESLYIESTPQLAMNQQWLFSKQQIAGEIIDSVGVDRVVIREVIDGSGGMMGGLGGMMGGDMGGEDVESALEDADVDAEELVEELDLEEGEGIEE